MGKSVLTIRLDDITPDMDWGKFERLKAIFDEYGIKPLIGVVPDNQDPKLKVGKARADFWEYILELQKDGWSISQHGYTHVYDSQNGGLLGLHRFSEFAGLPYEVQLDRLKKGREILQSHGIYATIFMAPGHTFDENTLKALKELDFQYVTDGYASKPYKRSGLTFIPCKISSPKTVTGYDTLCLHLNHMSEEEMEELHKFLGNNKDLVVSYAKVLDEDFHKEYNDKIASEEEKALRARNKRKNVANDTVMQRYLQRTYSEKKWLKQIKRILGLPRLMVELLIRKIKK